MTFQIEMTDYQLRLAQRAFEAAAMSLPASFDAAEREELMALASCAETSEPELLNVWWCPLTNAGAAA